MPGTTGSKSKVRYGREIVGLRDIAEDVGVSISLVSKVLSGRLGTSGAHSDMVSAIRDRAKELGYSKNRLAEALRTGRQNVIGVCVHKHGASGSGIVEETVAGIAEEASRHRQRLMLHYYQSTEEFRDFAPEAHRNAVDGVIIAGISHREIVEDLDRIHQGGVPVITVLDEQLDSRFINVGLDQWETTRLATLHLLDQGCRRLAHFRVMPGLHPLPDARYEGFCLALAERGVTLNPELVLSVPDFGYEAGLKATRELLDRKAKFDGIVCQADHLAVAAINVLVTAGRAVPQQVKVTGVDDAPFCRFCIVPATSVSQEFYARGQLAVQLLITDSQKKSLPVSRVAPVLHVRASSASV